MVGEIKPVDLEGYQVKRKAEGRADHTIDEQIKSAKAVINKAFDNDKIGGDPVKVFRRVKKLLKRNGNARKRILSRVRLPGDGIPSPSCKVDRRDRVLYRDEENGILRLTWEKVSMKDRVIRLTAADTKDREALGDSDL